MKTTNAKINELARMYPHVLKGDIKNMAVKYKTERGFINALAKTNEENEKAHTRPIPDRIEIELEWHGCSPRGSMRYYREGHGLTTMANAFYAGGWGYDKTSTILSQCLNEFHSLKWGLRHKNKKKAPYGVYFSPYKDGVSFDYGIGESCYYRICDWMGYKMTHVAEGKNYDKFIIVRKGFKK